MPAFAGQQLFGVLLVERDEPGHPAIGKALPVQLVEDAGHGGAGKAQQRQGLDELVADGRLEPSGEGLVGEDGVKEDG